MSEAAQARRIAPQETADPATAEHSWSGSGSCFRDERQPGKLYSGEKHMNMEKENAEV